MELISLLYMLILIQTYLAEAHNHHGNRDSLNDGHNRNNRRRLYRSHDEDEFYVSSYSNATLLYSDEHFHCPGNGHFPDPASCHKFFICKNSKSKHYQCTGEDNIYWPETRACQKENNQTIVCGFFDCNRNDRNLVAYPNEPSIYAKCHHRKPSRIFKCSNGNYFDENIQKCQSDCNFNNVLPDYKHCEKYMKCEKTKFGKVQYKKAKCPIGTWFNVDFQQCSPIGVLTNCPKARLHNIADICNNKSNKTCVLNNSDSATEESSEESDESDDSKSSNDSSESGERSSKKSLSDKSASKQESSEDSSMNSKNSSQGKENPESAESLQTTTESNLGYKTKNSKNNENSDEKIFYDSKNSTTHSSVFTKGTTNKPASLFPTTVYVNDTNKANEPIQEVSALDLAKKSINSTSGIANTKWSIKSTTSSFHNKASHSNGTITTENYDISTFSETNTSYPTYVTTDNLWVTQKINETLKNSSENQSTISVPSINSNISNIDNEFSSPHYNISKLSTTNTTYPNYVTTLDPLITQQINNTSKNSTENTSIVPTFSVPLTDNPLIIQQTNETLKNSSEHQSTVPTFLVHSTDNPLVTQQTNETLKNSSENQSTVPTFLVYSTDNPLATQQINETLKNSSVNQSTVPTFMVYSTDNPLVTQQTNETAKNRSEIQSTVPTFLVHSTNNALVTQQINETLNNSSENQSTVPTISVPLTDNPLVPHQINETLQNSSENQSTVPTISVPLTDNPLVTQQNETLNNSSEHQSTIPSISVPTIETNTSNTDNKFGSTHYNTSKLLDRNTSDANSSEIDGRFTTPLQATYKLPDLNAESDKNMIITTLSGVDPEEFTIQRVNTTTESSTTLTSEQAMLNDSSTEKLEESTTIFKYISNATTDSTFAKNVSINDSGIATNKNEKITTTKPCCVTQSSYVQDSTGNTGPILLRTTRSIHYPPKNISDFNKTENATVDTSTITPNSSTSSQNEQDNELYTTEDTESYTNDEANDATENSSMTDYQGFSTEDTSTTNEVDHLITTNTEENTKDLAITDNDVSSTMHNFQTETYDQFVDNQYKTSAETDTIETQNTELYTSDYITDELLSTTDIYSPSDDISQSFSTTSSSNISEFITEPNYDKYSDNITSEEPDSNSTQFFPTTLSPNAFVAPFAAYRTPSVYQKPIPHLNISLNTTDSIVPP